jgi:hypothetical protein
MFEHRKMLNAKFQGGQGGSIEADLKKVVEAFALLQDERHSADYDVDLIWARSEVVSTLEIADEAFLAWKKIRKDKLAQDHLLTMFGARRS